MPRKIAKTPEEIERKRLKNKAYTEWQKDTMMKMKNISPYDLVLDHSKLKKNNNGIQD